MKSGHMLYFFLLDEVQVLRSVCNLSSMLIRLKSVSEFFQLLSDIIDDVDRTAAITIEQKQ